MSRVSLKPLSSSFAAMANCLGLRSSVFKPLRSRKLFAARISAFATFLIEALAIITCLMMRLINQLIGMLILLILGRLLILGKFSIFYFLKVELLRHFLLRHRHPKIASLYVQKYRPHTFADH